jgi:hypothetical protein
MTKKTPRIYQLGTLDRDDRLKFSFISSSRVSGTCWLFCLRFQLQNSQRERDRTYQQVDMIPTLNFEDPHNSKQRDFTTNPHHHASLAQGGKAGYTLSLTLPPAQGIN